MVNEVPHDDCSWFAAGERDEKAGQRLVALCQELITKQSTLLTNTDQCISVFQYGTEARGNMPEDHVGITDEVMYYNAAQNTVETVHAKVTKNRVAVMSLTSGGGYLQRSRAKKLNKALDGVFSDNDVDHIEDEMMMDALTTDHGAGACRVLECEDKVEIKHVPIEDVWFDPAETRQREPRSLYYVPRDGMDKYVAAALFCEGDVPGAVGDATTRREAIMNAAGRQYAWANRGALMADMKQRVAIYEAWHLPSSEPIEADEEDEDGNVRRVPKHDGRHVVAVEGLEGTLIDEPWDGKGGFPILLLVPRARRRHVLGLSLMRDLLGPQREYERLTAKVQDQHAKMGVSGWYAGRQQQIEVRDIEAGTFGAGFVVEADGPNPPVPIVTEPVAPGTLQYKDSIPNDMLIRNGVSAMSAASQIPAGLQNASGKALQVFDDSEDGRNMPYHRAREQFKVKLAWLVIETARRVVARKGTMKSRYRGKSGLELIDWKQVIEDAEDFVLTVFPVGALSKQPAARFQQLTDLLNMQAITVEQFKRLFEIPDLESESEIDTADTDIIDRNLDLIVVEGRYLSPEPFDNLALCIERAGKFYNLCRQKDVPEARLNLVRQFIASAKSLQDQAAAATAPPPPDPMAPPGAPPPLDAPMAPAGPPAPPIAA